MKESSFYQEIMEEGRVEERQATIREALEDRFGMEEAANLDGFIRQITDISRLRELSRLTNRCRRLTEFRKEVEPKRRARPHRRSGKRAGSR